jgi:leucyl/phenylalanyl-tRNA--protein transferase
MLSSPVPEGRSVTMPVYQLPDTGISFPDPRDAEPDGLLAVGGNLSPHRLVAAYSLGLFPWYHEDTPPLWWTPDPRCILLPEEFHLPRSLARVLKQGLFTFSLDRAFPQVIRACAEPRGKFDGTWLVPEMIEAYTALHKLGLAHSVEAWRDGVLTGGLYGIFLGSVFFGESMFYREPDASKAAFAHLVAVLRGEGCTLIDCQQVTGHLLRFGAKPVPRTEFMRILSDGLAAPLRQGSWRDGIPKPAKAAP